MLMGKIGGSFRECGSYYPVLTYADELWDLFYVEACQELDREFPEAASQDRDLVLQTKGKSRWN